MNQVLFKKQGIHSPRVGTYQLVEIHVQLILLLELRCRDAFQDLLVKTDVLLQLPASSTARFDGRWLVGKSSLLWSLQVSMHSDQRGFLLSHLVGQEYDLLETNASLVGGRSSPWCVWRWNIVDSLTAGTQRLVASMTKGRRASTDTSSIRRRLRRYRSSR